MDIESFKWICVTVVLITTFLGCAGVLCINNVKWTGRLESLAGGVFIGAGLAHLLTEAIHELADASEYPIAAAVCAGTFALLTAIRINSAGSSEHEHDSNSGGLEYSAVRDDPEMAHSERANEGGVTMFGNTNDHVKVPLISLYITMMIHSVIEGIAMGIVNHWATMIAMACAIIGHKPIEGFALSIQIIKSRPTQTLFWILIVLFSAMTPIGSITGIFLVKWVQNQVMIGIITAFSAGTFLYAGILEWTEKFGNIKELDPDEKNWDLLSFIIGLVWMLLIAVVEII